MFRLWRQFGDALDRSGLAGWLLLLCGFGIIGVTLLAPAWLDVRQLEAQVSVLERQHQVLEMRHQNYRAFVRAVERSDPMVMQRLAMHLLSTLGRQSDLPGACERTPRAPLPCGAP